MALSSWKEGLLSLATRKVKEYEVLESLIFGTDGGKGAKIKYPSELQAEIDILEEEVKIKRQQLTLYKEEHAINAAGMRKEINILSKEIKELRKVHAITMNDMKETPHSYIFKTPEFRLVMNRLSVPNRSLYVERKANLCVRNVDKCTHVQRQFHEKVREMETALRSMHELYMDHGMDIIAKEKCRHMMQLENECRDVKFKIDSGRMMQRKYRKISRYLKDEAFAYNKLEEVLKKKVADQIIELDMMRLTWEEIAFMNLDLKSLIREERALLADRRDRILYRKGMERQLRDLVDENFRLCRHMKPTVTHKRVKKAPPMHSDFDRAFEDMELRMEHLKDVMQCLDYERLPGRAKELQRVNRMLKERATLESDQVSRLEGLRNKVKKLLLTMVNFGEKEAKKFIKSRLTIENYFMANRRRTKKYSRSTKLVLKTANVITFGVWALTDIMDFVTIADEPIDIHTENLDEMIWLAREKIVKLMTNMQGHNVREELPEAIKRHKSELPDGLCLYPIMCIPVEFDDELELKFDEEEDAEDEDIYNREDVKMYSRLMYVRRTARPGFFEQFQSRKMQRK